MTGTSSTPRLTSPTSAGNVSILARSPVAPKMTNASTLSDMFFLLMEVLWDTDGCASGATGQGSTDGANGRSRGSRLIRWAALLRRCRCSKFADAHPPAKDVVGPRLVREHQRQENDDHD